MACTQKWCSAASSKSLMSCKDNSCTPKDYYTSFDIKHSQEPLFMCYPFFILQFLIVSLLRSHHDICFPHNSLYFPHKTIEVVFNTYSLLQLLTGNILIHRHFPSIPFLCCSVYLFSAASPSFKSLKFPHNAILTVFSIHVFSSYLCLAISLLPYPTFTSPIILRCS